MRRVSKSNMSSLSVTTRFGGALCALTVGLVMLAGTPAAAQPADDLQRIEDRLYRIERDVEGLVRLGVSGSAGVGPSSDGSVDGDMAARLSVRLTTLETEIANLTGMIEEMRHAIAMEQKTAQKARDDFEFRLRALETKAAAGGSASGGATPGGAASGDALMGGGAGTQLPPDDLFANNGAAANEGATANGNAGAGADVMTRAEPVPQLEPKDLYQAAMRQLAERNYTQAESYFTAFMDRFPDHLLAGNAQYWLGESYYARNDYKQAAAAFLSGVRAYPDSGKAPGAMLKLAMSLNQLGHKAQACATLGELKTRHPDMSAKVKARVSREEQAMACE